MVAFRLEGESGKLVESLKIKGFRSFTVDREIREVYRNTPLLQMTQNDG
jgi:hypothetical protein